MEITMKKTISYSLITAALLTACLGGVGYLLAKVLKTDAAQEKLFEILGEDLFLAILDKVRLLGDLLMWPIDFVRALLP